MTGKLRKIAWIFLLMALVPSVTASAETVTEEFTEYNIPGPVEIHYDGEPAAEKTISWTTNTPADEFRYMKGTHTFSDFGAAEPAGNGSGGSMTVTENGNYTVFARYGESGSATVVTVTCIDTHSPDIYLGCVTGNADGTVTVSFSVEDYYDGDVEVRIAEGEMSTWRFPEAEVVSGRTLEGLRQGVYTLFARDRAGNISTYTLNASMDSSEQAIDEEESEPFHEEEETEWHDSFAEAEVLTAVASVRKVDSHTGLDLKDAKLQIIDRETGLIKDEWISNGERHVTPDLLPGRTYILRESCYPKGYRKAPDMEFVPENGETVELFMADDPENLIPEETPPKETTPVPKPKDPPSPVPQEGKHGYTVPKETEPPAPETEPVIGSITAEKTRKKTAGAAVERLPQTGGNDGILGLSLLLILTGALGFSFTRKRGKGEKKAGS